MKIPSHVKLLALVFMLVTAHALATPVTIGSNQNNYTFLGGTTYFITNNITLSGTTTFQDGTILKYNGDGQINIPANGTIVCPSSEMAIFTSMNDDTVGDTIPGSSGTPSATDITDPDGPYDVNTFLCVSNVVLSNMSFAYAWFPFENPPNGGTAFVGFENCQFLYIFDIEVETLVISDCVFAEVGDVDWWPIGGEYYEKDLFPDDGPDSPDEDDNVMQNNIFVDCGQEFVDAVWSSNDEDANEVWVQNNLFDSSNTAFNFQGWDSALLGGGNAFYNTGDELGPDSEGGPMDGDYTIYDDPDYWPMSAY